MNTSLRRLQSDLIGDTPRSKDDITLAGRQK